MHIFLKTIDFGWKKGAGSIPGVVFGSNPIKTLISFFRFGFEINPIMTTLKLL